MKKPHYSSIRREATVKPDPGFMSQLYDSALKPDKLVGLLGAFGVVAYTVLTDLPKEGPPGRDGLFACMLFMSLLGGLRAVQSIWLAKRDYAHLESRLILDVIVFVGVLLFTAGLPLRLFLNQPIAMMWTYAGLMLVGTINFAVLYFFRLESGDDELDLPIDRRIQLVNMVTFVLIAAALCYSAFLVTRHHGGADDAVYAAILCTGPLFALNMWHSDELTFMPKFMFTNKPDAPKKRIALFRMMFWEKASRMTNDAIWSCIADVPEDRFRLIRTVRVQASETRLLIRLLLDGFGYVFRTAFGTEDVAKLVSMLHVLLRHGSGLTRFGYLQFYWVFDVTDARRPRRIGFVKLETSHRHLLYGLIGWPVLFWMTMRIFGPRHLASLRTRVRDLVRAWPPPVKKEVRLAYLYVEPAERRKGYGATIMQLLNGALIWTTTNDIVADRLTLVAREHNAAGMGLFNKAGYRAVRHDDAPVPDILACRPGIGPATLLEYTRVFDE